MTPIYAQWRERQRQAVALYRQGVTAPEIADRMQIAANTVYRYLRLAGIGSTLAAQRVPNVWPNRRAPYWELHKRLGACEIVCGRKFCSRCGRWRLLSDFPHSRVRGVPLPNCATCQRLARAYSHRHATEAQRENIRERQRIYYEGKRREAGIPETTAKRRRVVDRAERIMLPVEPLLTELARYRDGELTELATRAGVSERALYRYRYGESRRVRIDVADRLAVAMGLTSSLIWSEVW